MSGTMKSPLLILEAAGIIGSGVVEAAVDKGWPVIAVAPDAAGLERLRTRHAHADLTTLVGSVATDADAAQLAANLQDLGRPLAGVVVAIVAGTARGRLLDQPSATLCQQLDRDLLPHLAAARQLLPLLAQAGRGGSYVLIGGPGSEMPWAGYGHRSVAAAALRMLASVLHDEARTLGLRLHLLSVDVPVCVEQDGVKACPHWPTAASIGHRALDLMQRDDGAPSQAIVQYDRKKTSGATSARAPGEHGEPDSVSSYVRHLLAKALHGERRTATHASQDPDIHPRQHSRRYPAAPPASSAKALTFPLRQARP
jgi:NAD(P)-dependent dehydrogenase (short-subunit alcohol dehydrogenase family)